MKRTLKHVMTILTLMMTFGLTAYASDGHVLHHQRSETTNVTAAQPAADYAGRHKDGHPNYAGRHRDGHPN